MRNVIFNLGFLVDREKLEQYVIKKAGDRKISPVKGGFIGMHFLVEIDSIDDMPVYKIKIEQNGDLIEKDSIPYEEFCLLSKNSKSLKKNVLPYLYFELEEFYFLEFTKNIKLLL